MTRRQREAKSRAAWGKETSQSVGAGKYEKCYVCKSLVPMKEYQRHVDGCLQLQSCSKSANGTQGVRRLRRAKDEGRNEGRLLNMLEQSEHKAADAEVAAARSGEDLRCSSPEVDKEAECDKDDWSHFPHASCSDSPIKSFTSISEAKSCLVDFKKQLATDRQQTKASFRRRKKF
ncbi:UNVERIFIED_CONTAM: hypothetical protein K2H54_040312 [Gekko kuhli]